MNSYLSQVYSCYVKCKQMKKVTQSKIRWIKRLFQYGDVPLSQELQNAQHTQSDYFLDMLKSSVIIFQTALFHVQQSVKQSTDDHHIPPALMLTSVLFVEGLPLLESSFTFSHTPLNFLCHPKTHLYEKMLSPYTYWSLSSTFDGVFSTR